MRKTICCVLSLFALCCLFMTVFPVTTEAGSDDSGQQQAIRIAYTDWSSSIASGSLIKAVFQEKLGLRCDLVRMTVDEMWRAVAEGRVDAMLSAWLPDTHAHYLEEFGERVVDLGPNLSGTRTGLVVPDVKMGRLAAGAGIRKSYIKIDSIEEIKEHADKFNRRVIGIEPQAGIMRQTAAAMEAYGLNDFELVTGSEAAMIEELSRAIHRQSWVVVTGWIPHWSFARWNLKFLDDPRKIYGEKGYIHTIARTGLKKEMPDAFRLLDHFNWQPEEVGQLMLWIQEDEGRFPYDKAIRWLRTNPGRIDDWIRGDGS